MSLINQFSLKFNIPKVTFEGTTPNVKPVFKHIGDDFVTSPLNQKFGASELQLQEELNANPQILALLKSNKIPIKINYEELENLKKGHLLDTRVLAAKIYSSLPPDLKSKVDLPTLQEAAMYHDYGKVLIPLKILKKTSELTDAERKIIELHPVLSYEMLKNKALDEKTLALIKYHHQVPDGSGYPAITEDFDFGLEAQILNVADRYSALCEKRSYKDAMSKKEALDIIKQDVDNGLISRHIYYALSMV